MKTPEYIRLERTETNRRPLNHPAVVEEWIKQGKKKIDKDKLLLCVITHTFKDTALPLSLDYLFLDKDMSKCAQHTVTIRGCFNYRHKFHTKLWKGYNHLAILEMESPFPAIFQSLKPYKERKRWDPNLILCHSSGAENCKQHIKTSLEKHDAFMKENNPEIWLKNKMEEEAHKQDRPLD